MLDNIFPFMDAPDDDILPLVIEVQSLFESQEDFEAFASAEMEGGPYELHLLLQKLQGGEINFRDFLERAVAWSGAMLDESGKLKLKRGA